ncbi:MAG: tetratricopeptide repeat protein [Cyclobacteriaceae bacterium]
MDKTLFLQILQHYASTSVEEAKEIALLKGEFPYSQLLQTLSARASKDHGFQHQQRDLQLAAVYAADRALLKEIITLSPEEPVQQVISKHVNANEQVASTIDSVDVADVIMDDLERLSKLKNTFENLFMDYPKSKKGGSETIPQPQPVESETISPVIQETPLKSSVVQETPIKPSPAIQETPVKSKKERIIEMAKALTNNPDGEGGSAAKKKHLDKDGNPVDELIAEIQSSKQEIIPENERQKQQIEIINQFIRIQPSISNPKDRGPSAIGDLTPVKSGEFGDNIVSETLVEILIKQGKKDRAIEVLKKLIWKYPQKKAYFASQIEDLKK